MIRTALLLLDVATFVGVMTPQAQAHQEEIGLVIIAHPYVEPARAGDDTFVRLRIENLGSSTRQVIGVHSDVARNSAIEVQVEPIRFVPIGSLPVRAGEILDLEYSARVRLVQLKRDLVYGETIQACLDFADGRKKDLTLTVGQFEL